MTNNENNQSKKQKSELEKHVCLADVKNKNVSKEMRIYLQWKRGTNVYQKDESFLNNIAYYAFSLTKFWTGKIFLFVKRTRERRTTFRRT